MSKASVTEVKAATNSKEIVENKDRDDGPSTGAFGVADVPDAINFQKSLIHIPEINAENLNKMMRIDGEISGLYRILSTPLRGSNIQVKESHSRAKREANFIREVLLEPYANGGMVIPLHTVLATIMRMLIDGWAPHEIVWEIKNGQVRVEKIEYRPVHSIKPKIDEKNNLIGYKQDLTRVKKNFADPQAKREIDIPADKVMHFVNGPEWNYIFGRSIFTQAYYHFEKKHKLYYVSHLAAQINALRLRRLKIPTERENKKDEYVKEVAKLGFNSTIALPDDVELELLDVGNNYVDITPLIQHHDAQAAKSVLAQVIDLGVEGRTGSFNLSDTHLDVFLVNLELIATYIAEVFNTVLIPKLIDWNFGTGNYPRVQFQPFDRLVKASLFEIYTRVSSSASLNISPELLVELEKTVADTLGLDMDYDEITPKTVELFRKKIVSQSQSPNQGGDSSSGAGDSDTRDRSTRTT